MKINWDTISVVGARALLSELERIPLYDVHGGRQRNSEENTVIEKLRVWLKKHDQ